MRIYRKRETARGQIERERERGIKFIASSVDGVKGGRFKGRKRENGAKACSRSPFGLNVFRRESRKSKPGQPKLSPIRLAKGLQKFSPRRLDIARLSLTPADAAAPFDRTTSRSSWRSTLVYRVGEQGLSGPETEPRRRPAADNSSALSDRSAPSIFRMDF